MLREVGPGLPLGDQLLATNHYADNCGGEVYKIHEEPNPCKTALSLLAPCWFGESAYAAHSLISLPGNSQMDMRPEQVSKANT